MPVSGPVSRTVTIASGQSLSAEVDMEEFSGSFVIVMPAAWTTANLTFQAASASGGTFQDVYDDAGTEVSVTVAASRTIGVNKPALAPFRYLKFRSGTSGSAVTQAAQRVLTLLAE